jgi:glycosyltransferase involved in cell wall biosynthesis
MKMARVCFVAVPLTARSGVYMSTFDLVAAARQAGLDWSAVVAMRSTAAGAARTDVEGVFETTIDEHGAALLPAIKRLLRSRAEVLEADVVITMIGQSDIVVRWMKRGLNGAWVSFVRGLPWPDRGEAGWGRRTVQRLIVKNAMKHADEVWATTEVLAKSIASAGAPVLVPAGVPIAQRTSLGERSYDGIAVFAGRLDRDKRADFFQDVMRHSELRGRIYGDGPLRDDLLSTNPVNVEFAGWVGSQALWSEASVFLGTSRREAFGRSAVEAAMRGVPVILSDEYGCAPLLVTEKYFRDLFILPLKNPKVWSASLKLLLDDEALRRRYSDHIYSNALRMGIENSAARIEERVEYILSGEGQ